MLTRQQVEATAAGISWAGGRTGWGEIMPTYQINFGSYHCPTCGELTEWYQMPEGDPPPCPHCLEVPGDQDEQDHQDHARQGRGEGVEL